MIGDFGMRHMFEEPTMIDNPDETENDRAIYTLARDRRPSSMSELAITSRLHPDIFYSSFVSLYGTPLPLFCSGQRRCSRHPYSHNYDVKNDGGGGVSQCSKRIVGIRSLSDGYRRSRYFSRSETIIIGINYGIFEMTFGALKTFGGVWIFFLPRRLTVRPQQRDCRVVH